MRIILPAFAAILLFSCGSDDHTAVSEQKSTVDTNLRLPALCAGMPLDTSLPALRISMVNVFSTSDSAGLDTDKPTLLITYDTSATAQIVNVYADSSLLSSQVDSIVNMYCTGKDLRLIGTNNGQEIAIPFHTTHRFASHHDSLGVWENEFHLVFVDEDNISVNDWPDNFKNARDYFRAFYGNAFNPVDSSNRYPQRKYNRQTIESLMLEGQAWDETDIKHSDDTALMLAAYNEFVNKLEVFDKVGTFTVLRSAEMDLDPLPAVTWGRMMRVFGEHYSVLQSLRNDAKKYLSDKLANDGGKTDKEFTEEDLRLLYPDRLRWNGRISGVYEHRYDPDLLSHYYWISLPASGNPPQEVPLDQGR